MEFFGTLTGAAALGINVHAALALFLGMRSRDAAVIARYARRCAWSAAGFAALSAIEIAAPFFASAPRSDNPTERATRLAMAISESMNCGALLVPTVLLPLVAAVVLFRRAWKAGARK